MKTIDALVPLRPRLRRRRRTSSLAATSIVVAKGVAVLGSGESRSSSVDFVMLVSVQVIVSTPGLLTRSESFQHCECTTVKRWCTAPMDYHVDVVGWLTDFNVKPGPRVIQKNKN